ncbi:MAG: 4Fe-4S dicluster domain-containing protein [Thermodesulfobacteriota bacterium]
MAKTIKIDKQKWRDEFARVADKYRVIAPQIQDGVCDFRQLEKGETPELNFSNTRLSPKAVTFPQTETLFEYTLDPADPDCNIMKSPAGEPMPTAVVGIRPCDARAMTLVKLNFDTPDYQDPYWLKRYEATTFVGLACDNPCPTCFCSSVGGGPYDETGLDMLLADRGDFLLAKSLTPKGDEFLKTGGWDAPAGAADDLAAAGKAAAEKITTAVPTDKLAEKSLLDLYNAPFWSSLGFSCINCGTCTFLCPTCWCFDIQDENHRKKGVRMRNWDSCMFPLFTVHTTGHNPRGEKIQRVRQRFMHKLKYFLDKYQAGVMCTGCGRCVRKCPVNIDIRAVCKMMNSYEASNQPSCKAS